MSAIRMSPEEFEAACSRINSKRVIKELPRSSRAKYGNRKTQIDGITFDSKREAHRYVELRRMAEAGLIENLRCQVPFVLAPAVTVKGRKRPPLRYYADFVFDQDGKQVVEDVKGRVTDGYRIKRHLMASVHGIEVVEV